MKRFFIVLSIVSSVLIMLVAAVYLGLAKYYEKGFAFGTYINGIYCTGKTPEEVNEELNESFAYHGITIITTDKEYTIPAEALEYSFDFKEPLKQYLEEQNPYLWGLNMIRNGKTYELSPKGSYNQDKLLGILDETVFSLLPKPGVTIKTGYDGFICEDTKVNCLNKEEAIRIIEDALLHGKETVDLVETECYENLPYSEKEKELLSLFDTINDYQSRSLSFLIGEEEVTVPSVFLARTLVAWDTFSEDKISEYVDEEGNLLINEEMAEDIVEQILEPYNTYQNHDFITHDGKTVHISTGNYGNQMKMKPIKKAVTEFLASDESTLTITPEYSKEVPLKGKDDIGNTYIEVDLQNQKLYYYEEGELLIAADVVTGYTKKGRGTPAMVCSIYAKQKNRILRGPGYESFVYYWMPVNGGIGIHDATWRTEFGGEIYKTDGSHGCINMPLELAELLYEKAEIGTPCVIY